MRPRKEIKPMTFMYVMYIRTYYTYESLLHTSSISHRRHEPDCNMSRCLYRLYEPAIVRICMGLVYLYSWPATVKVSRVLIYNCIYYNIFPSVCSSVDLCKKFSQKFQIIDLSTFFFRLKIFLIANFSIIFNIKCQIHQLFLFFKFFNQKLQK